MTAKLISRSGGSSLVNGFLQYNLTNVYRVDAPRTSSIVTILNWPGIPTAGSKVILGGTTVWVGNPTVNQPNPDESVFIVTVPFGNQTTQFERDFLGNPVSDPVEIVKRVRIEYYDESEPVTDAKLRGITKGKSEGLGGVPVTAPTWLPIFGPPTNSAGEPIALERVRRAKRISVERVSRDWQSTWDSFQDSINSDTVTIIEKDIQGVRATHTFQPLTLKMSIETPNEWKDGKLYFRPRFIMDVNPDTWIHSELDRGTKRRVFVDQYNPKGGQYVQGDLDALEIDGDFGFASILTDNDKVAIGEPILFNGTGAEQPLTRTTGGSYTDGEPFWLNYEINQNIRAFGPLNL